MILLVDKNALSALNESLSALFVKRMYDAVLSKQDLIILVVVTEKPELEIMITDAVDARVKSIASRSWWIFVSATSRCRCWKQSFLEDGVQPAFCPLPRQWVNTIHWLMPLLPRTEHCGGGNLIQSQLRKHYLIGAVGIDLRPQYPWCAGCQHHFFDGSPENATINEWNLDNVANYMWVCHKVKAWKNNKENVEQPRCLTTLELIKKGHLLPSQGRIMVIAIAISSRLMVERGFMEYAPSSASWRQLIRFFAMPYLLVWGWCL